MLFQAGCGLQNKIFRVILEGIDFFDHGICIGKGSGFIKNDGSGLGNFFKIFSAFYADSKSCGFLHCGKNCNRSGKLHCAGIIYHKGRHGLCYVAGKKPGKARKCKVKGHNFFCKVFRAALNVCLKALGIINHLDDVLNLCVLAG